MNDKPKKSKHKDMELENMTTAQLLALIDEGSYTNAEIVAELQSEERAIPTDYSDTAMRGGIRPTRPNL